jgi:dUTP pyrophosphatase
MKVKITKLANHMDHIIRPDDAQIVVTAGINLPVLIGMGTTAVIPTGIKVDLPEGHIGILTIDQLLSLNSNVSLVNGITVLDSESKGEVLVGLINNKYTSFSVNPGDIIGTIHIIKTATIKIEG